MKKTECARNLSASKQNWMTEFWMWNAEKFERMKMKFTETTYINPTAPAPGNVTMTSKPYNEIMDAFN